MFNKEFSHSFTPVIVTLLLAASLPLGIRGTHYEKFFEIEGGPKYMYYYARFNVGKTSTEQSTIIDTGSDTLAFPCDHCIGEDCGTHQDHRFQTHDSKTFHYEMSCPVSIFYHDKKVCQFVKSYAEGSSLLGFLASDYLNFKNVRRYKSKKVEHFNSKLRKDLYLKAEFGCTTKETGLFKSQYADGILGLDNASSFIESMEKKNSVDKNLKFSFGLCFHKTGGIMSVDLREPDSSEKIVMLDRNINVYQKPVVTPYIDHNNYYEIQADKFYLEDQELPNTWDTTVMIDSGTTFTHFPAPYLQGLLGLLNAYCKRNNDKCGKIKNAQFKEDSCLQLKFPDEDYKSEDELLASFPNIKIQFKGSNHLFILYPKNYFYKEFSQDGTLEPKEVRLCMALRGDESDRIIFGAFGMIDYYFYFDRVQKKIKIFQEDCSTRTNKIMHKKAGRILAVLPQSMDDIKQLDARYMVAASASLILVLWLIRRRKSASLTNQIAVPLKE